MDDYISINSDSYGTESVLPNSYDDALAIANQVMNGNVDLEANTDNALTILDQVVNGDKWYGYQYIPIYNEENKQTKKESEHHDILHKAIGFVYDYRYKILVSIIGALAGKLIEKMIIK